MNVNNKEMVVNIVAQIPLGVSSVLAGLGPQLMLAILKDASLKPPTCSSIYQVN